MLLKRIHNNKIGTYALMLFLIILCWIKPITLGYAINAESFDNAMPLWKLFSFLSKSKWLGFLFSMMSAVIITLSINRLNSKHGLLSKQSALPGIVFVLLVGGFTMAQRFNPIWLTTLFFILAFEYLFEAHNHRRVMKECFLAGFWISAASLLSYKIVLVFPLLIVMMGNLRLLNFKSFLAAIIGLILPWLFLLGYELVWGSIPEYFKYLGFSWSKIFDSHYHTTFLLIYLMAMAFIFLVALFSVIGAYGTKKIYTRKQYQVFVFCGLFFSGVMGASGLNLEFLIMVALPFSIIIAHLIDNIRSLLWQNIVVVTMLAIPVFGQIFL
ncbi:MULTISPECIES: hypothetical protein [unclassified Saccharicrinis]|uniref:hypothetical protein n=1 Tax=unclassified Saccharicrinis TaxID=2646859 RepID=UPI003D324F63